MLGLIDSGADTSLFPEQLAALLGIDLAACAVMKGMTASGQSDRWAAPQPIQGECMGHTINLVSQFQSGLPLILLGRADFMARFKVSFDQRKSRFSLLPY